MGLNSINRTLFCRRLTSFFCSLWVLHSFPFSVDLSLAFLIHYLTLFTNSLSNLLISVHGYSWKSPSYEHPLTAGPSCHPGSLSLFLILFLCVLTTMNNSGSPFQFTTYHAQLRGQLFLMKLPRRRNNLRVPHYDEVLKTIIYKLEQSLLSLLKFPFFPSI